MEAFPPTKQFPHSWTQMAPSCITKLFRALWPKPPTEDDKSQAGMQRSTSPESPLTICDSREPAIVMENHSSYLVSFTAVQEDKLRTVAANTRLSRGVAVTLNTTVGAEGEARVHQEDEAKMEHENNYILMKDHKLGHNKSTSVPFPRKCEAMRVHGFFQPKDLSQPQMKRFKEKVYSISRGKKIITLEITDEELEDYLS